MEKKGGEIEAERYKGVREGEGEENRRKKIERGK